MEREFNIQAELKKLPHKPGVYLMHDADGPYDSTSGRPSV